MTLVKRTVLFALYAVGVALANVSVLRAMYELSRQDATASHLVLIPFVTIGLIWMSRQRMLATVQWDWPGGLILIGTGVALWLAARMWGAATHPGGLSLLVGAMAVLWAGGFLLFYGRAALRAAAFPILFLGFMIPIPHGVLDVAVAALKRGSTEAVAGLFSLTGTPYHRDGFVFSLPTVVIEVADECSGIRSSIALVLTSLLAGHMMLSSPWTKTLLVLLVFPLTILKNGIRIVTVSLLAIHVDPGFLTGQLHHEGGIVFFLLALAILFPFFALLRRFELKRNA